LRVVSVNGVHNTVVDQFELCFNIGVAIFAFAVYLPPAKTDDENPYGDEEWHKYAPPVANPFL
jgi:hypothetical protein